MLYHRVVFHTKNGHITNPWKTLYIGMINCFLPTGDLYESHVGPIWSPARSHHQPIRADTWGASIETPWRTHLAGPHWAARLGLTYQPWWSPRGPHMGVLAGRLFVKFLPKKQRLLPAKNLNSQSVCDEKKSPRLSALPTKICNNHYIIAASIWL